MGTEQEDAFTTLKQRLLSAPILVYPDFQKPFIISTDASDQAIGYVLGQRDQQGREHAIAYGGRKLHRDEQKWHISEKEGLSLVEAVKQFRPYIANTKFTIYTDNIALKWLNSIKNMNGRLGRWSLFLQAFNFEIKHKAGAQNTNADGLSRRDYDTQPGQEVTQTVNLCNTSSEGHTSQKDSLQVTFVYKYQNVQQVMALNPVMANDIQTENNAPEPNDVDVNDALREQQQNCPDFEEIMQYIEQREVPEDAGSARRVVAESSSFDIVDGILYHLHQDRNRGVPRDQRVIKQLAVPRILRDDLLKSYHDSIAGGGHQGYERTYEALRRKYYWPRMYSDVMQYTTSCVNCHQQSETPMLDLHRCSRCQSRTFSAEFTLISLGQYKNLHSQKTSTTTFYLWSTVSRNGVRHSQCIRNQALKSQPYCTEKSSPDMELLGPLSQTEVSHSFQNLSKRCVNYYTPRNEVRGGYTGITLSVRLSVCRRARLGKMVSSA